MKPLALSLQLVIDERGRLAAEICIVWENGETTMRRIDANNRLTVHFDDLEPETTDE